MKKLLLLFAITVTMECSIVHAQQPRTTLSLQTPHAYFNGWHDGYTLAYKVNTGDTISTVPEPIVSAIFQDTSYFAGFRNGLKVGAFDAIQHNKCDSLKLIVR